MIYAGKLDQTVKFQSVSVASDGMGGSTETWSDLSGTPVRAEYIPLRGRERLEAGKLGITTAFKLRIRRNTQITPACRVVYGGKNCKITGIEDYNRANDMVLWCEVVE